MILLAEKINMIKKLFPLGEEQKHLILWTVVMRTDARQEDLYVFFSVSPFDVEEALLKTGRQIHKEPRIKQFLAKVGAKYEEEIIQHAVDLPWLER